MATNGLGLEITELRLGLPGGDRSSGAGNEKKRVFSQIEGVDDGVNQDQKNVNVEKKSGAKAMSRRHHHQQQQQQVVGWPPVCSFRRKNSFKKANADEDQYSLKMYVKVSMDGAPFLRKINLSDQKDYSDLQLTLEKLFGSCFKLVEDYSSEYVPIYEDKEGDWMLVGDVPWTMFIESCKKLRIMKKTEAIGIGLRNAKETSHDG
ncbi:OLC1v1014697C1 [Oldenlandia corymbosa var. corymbosa]|uniref:Auxin-responsive protein n=1 Tax=Oldenlandia corymbosa var. corymbosa TaxID=529605 RepID=A0AAV1E1L8_OLDCO|nr:OLC1v1014697C1 [Oldenlandia corymbosa var. corymbosa]